MQAGARGITCAKLGEAEVMARAGIRDLLIANQVVGPLKMARLIDLARISDVIVAVDSEANAREIDQAARSAGLTINVLIEVDSGMHRCGTAPGEPTLTLARRVLSLTGLRFRGVMGYEGHAVALADRDLRVAGCESSAKLLVEAAEYVRANGIPVEIVSAGGTGSFDITGKVPGITELQCGSYATHDRAYREIGVEFENALTVLSTIISRPAPDRVIIDCGRKSCAPDHGMPAVRQRTDLDCVYLSEEHGKCNVLNPSCPLGPGDRIELIPGHGCTTINLHDEFYAVREGVVEAVWTIAARGKSR
jgi:D-serine deaminase-like pyridoxal phosphate-dependent protein